MAIVELVHSYKAPPERLWTLVTDFDALAEVCKPLVQFTGLPKGRVSKNMVVDVHVSIFGKLPNQPYRMEVLECDDDAMIMRSSEMGAGVKKWNHSLKVTANGTGAQLTEKIDIDAGVLTPIFAWWARKLYRHRHKPRQLLLGEPD